MITAINSTGMWFGGIDGVIRSVAGDVFHSRLARKAPLNDGEAIPIRVDGFRHPGGFKNVVFVIDDLKLPLHRIVFNGLAGAFNVGFKSVTIPTIRMGVMLGAVEKSEQEAVNEMAQGVKDFVSRNPDSFDRITFVVYNNERVQKLLTAALA